MSGILLARVKLFFRNPWTFVIFTVMSIAFALIIGGTGGATAVNVPIFAENETIQASVIGERLEENEAISFHWMPEAKVMERISEGKAEVGVLLKEDDFEVIVGIESPNVQIVEQTISSIYVEQLQRNQLLTAADAATNAEKEEFLGDLDSAMASPVFSIKTETFRSDDGWIFDNTFHTLFGFTLFFVIYTIAYTALPLLVEKKDGIWDRMILSPIKKWEMYVANLIYSFFEGYLQVVVIFLVFRFGVGVDFHGRFMETLLVLIPYVFSIVALSIFLTALMKNVQQFNAVIPIIAVSMAMIGGAYWPIEIVESKFLLALSKINPLTYGMEVLNGVAVYDYPLSELLFPISILLLMGVVFMGVGIHLMERRHI